MVVEVTDELGKSDRANVTVHVLAANLHRPTFLNAPFRVQIRENVPVGFGVIDLEALDEDVGENGRIIYSMSNDFADTFQLNASSGRLSTRKLLDRETIPIYVIPVTATDKGVPSLGDVTEILVELLDVNDNAPQWFPHDRYSLAVKEDLKPQTSILQVSASDPDFGSNGYVYYTFDGGDNANGTFTVDNALGTVRTSAPLDREKTAEYELIVVAVDRGDPAQSSSATISVRVIDVNDNGPVFPEDPLTYFVPENVMVGSSIGEISATDPDEDANAIVEYSIVGGPDAPSFALVTRPDGRPPLLSNLIELDHEGQKRDYKLIIRASSAHLQTDVSVNIIVTDVNDHSPVLRDFTIILNNFGLRNFPTGVIGKVPAMDRDATARLEYSITSGNKHNLLGIDPKTGEISLSSALNSDVSYSANFTVQVTDGLNTVSAVCTLWTLPVDQEMISNSVTLRVANMTARDMLEPAVFHGITQSLAYICVCSPEALFVFGIADDFGTAVPVVNITFAARASLTSQTYMSIRILKERVFAMRETLLNMTSLQLLPFSDEVCTREPCSNFEECYEVQKFGSAGSFIASGSMLFRPVQTLTTFNCKCSSGYTGMVDPSSCDTEINLCYSSPCGRNGSCHSTDGGYHCVCDEGFYGSKCEMEQGLVRCSDALCKGGATCTSGASAGLSCAGCPYEQQYRTELCELTTRAFSRAQDSYIAFPGIRSRNRFEVSLSLSTTSRDGMVFYNGQFSPVADFISLELVNGSAQFSFSLGQDAATVRLPTIITDGDWHRLEISYASRAARITVDDCDYALSLEHGRELDYHCAAVTTLHLDPHCSSVGALCNRFLDLSGPFYLGGLPTDYSDSRTGSHHFEGCIRNLDIDKKLTDMNDFIHQHGTSPGCPAKNDFCAKSPCQNGGSCSNAMDGRLCNCLPGFGGSDCSNVLAGETYGLDGDGYLLVVLSTMLSDSLDLKFEFRPNEASGILVAMTAKEHVSLITRLENHHLVVKVDEGNVAQGGTFLTTGRWYAFGLLIQNGHVTVFLGGKKELELDISNVDDDRGYSVLLGGKETGQNVERRVDGFNGCVREVLVANRLVSPTFRSNAQNGCPDLNRNCAAAPCPSSTSECKQVNGQFKCVCKHGFIGTQCKEVCSYEPCVSGVCLPSKESLHGYQCHCFENFTGQYCDKMIPQSCAADWWGYPLCGPCNCDVSKGFDQRCDQRDGTCRCRENFYRLPGADRCHECQCYLSGSLSSQCDEHGQCQCRDGVGGKRCDVCSDSWDELMEDIGCQRTFGSCPRALANRVWWDRTPFGMSSVQPCPGISMGSAVRSCDGSTQAWSNPDLRNCSTPSFISLDRLMLEYQEGILELTPHVSARLVRSLRSALNASMNEESLHLKDLSTAVNLTKIILKHEIQQSGMNLTHRIDRNFLLDLVESVSQTLDFRNDFHWKLLEQATINHLTQLFLEYLKTITTHLESTQMCPFEVFTKNLRTGISRSHRSMNQRSTQQNNAPNSLEIPASIPGVVNRVSVKLDGSLRSPSKLFYYAEFTDLPLLLSQTREARRPKSEFGPLLSSAFFFGESPAESGSNEVLYQFLVPVQPYLLTAHCVSWSFERNKWTNDKCSLLGWTYGTNGTYVECTCAAHLLVAVLSAGARSSVFRSVFPIFLFSIVVLALSLLLNLVTFVLLLAMRSNGSTICIAENLVLTAFATNLTFVLAANFEWDVVVCKILAAVLHYWVLAKFSWNLAQAINLLKYSAHSNLDRSSKSSIKFHLLLGYGLPIVPVVASIALLPDGYGADDVCWMLFGYQMLLSLILPVTVIVILTLLVVISAHCKAGVVQTRKPPAAAVVFEMRHQILVCTTISMFFVAGLSVAVVALNFGMASLGYVFPLLCLGEAIFMLLYLCIKVPEAQLLKEISFVWFLRKNFDKLSTKEKSRMKDIVCDTYQNPGLTISNSTTYHKAAQPDKDISGSIGRCSANSAFSHLSKSHPEDLIDNLNAYTSFQKSGDGTNEDTISVHSSSSSAKRYCSSARETNVRSPRVAHRSNSSLSTFGPAVPSWNSLPHSARTVKKNNIPSSHVRTTDSPKPESTFATFRPSSKGGHKFDAVRGEVFENPSENAIEIAKTGHVRNGSSKNFVTLDYVETGTAV
ncbi:hypothetical protein RvY_05301 [Ramazzottius varieornatus]|uniref:Uncharacterized protein n=1 Tax=Ramazzottius varieornatus TaxID=947166 RepID=A0A1D1V194_RAMVA|nr:hypothetical protein RvY_05301 [Ramazzottius varieornatus]